MNTANNTARVNNNNNTACVCCAAVDADIVRYTVRGISGTPATGRIVLKGRPLCDDCSESFETASNG